MGIGKNQRTPTPPDPQATAAAQTQSNVDTAVANAQLNNVNQQTPWGSVTYSSTPGAGGIPQYTQTTTLSPNQQALNDAEERNSLQLAGLAGDQLGRVQDILGSNYDPRRIDLSQATGGPLDISGALGSFDASRYDPTQSGLDLGNGPDYTGYDPTSRLGNFGDDVRARSFSLATQGLEDQFNRSEETLRTRLANQGINAGTSAFDAEMESFNRGKGNAYADALLAADSNALAQRGQAAGELAQGASLAGMNRADYVGSRGAENADQLTRLGLGYDQYMGGRGQSLAELLGQRDVNRGEAEQQYGYDTTADLAGRQNPLNEIIALMSGVQTNPINPGQPAYHNIAGTDYAGIVNQGYANQMAGYNAQTQRNNGLLSALGNLGAAGITAFSDVRLKRDIEYSHTDAKGLRWWFYRYLWDAAGSPKRFGVMAQEAPAHAVHVMPGGWLAVDYGAL